MQNKYTFKVENYKYDYLLDRVKNREFGKLIYNSLMAEINFSIKPEKYMREKDSIDFHKLYLEDRNNFIEAVMNGEGYEIQSNFKKYSIMDLNNQFSDAFGDNVQYDYSYDTAFTSSVGFHLFTFTNLTEEQKKNCKEIIKYFYINNSKDFIENERDNIRDINYIYKRNIDIFSKSFIKEHIKLYEKIKRELLNFNERKECGVYNLEYDEHNETNIKLREFFNINPFYLIDICDLLKRELLRESIYIRYSNGKNSSNGNRVICFEKHLEHN